MPFVVNQGVRIHCESIGNDPTLVLHHGTLGSGTDFIDCGYMDALKADHQVILLDSRGHCQSDKPHDPRAYDLALRAGAKSVKLLKHGTLKFYPGLPHGMPTTHADTINADLLAFIKA
jgi:hypothetical protein